MERFLKEGDILLGKKSKSMARKKRKQRKRMVSENLGEEKLLQMNLNSVLPFLVGRGEKDYFQNQFCGL